VKAQNIASSLFKVVRVVRVAVLNETSSADKNQHILNALSGRDGVEVFNLGMTKNGVKPELTYIHTGLLTGLILNLGKADLIVGGCGTGQGFLNAAIQYPNVFCGLIKDPMDAWLFAQINGGNALSLTLNYQYGWAGEENLKLVFDRLFSVEQFGCGYPEHRKDSQQKSRKTLENISNITHKKMSNIIKILDSGIVKEALEYPGILDYLDIKCTDAVSAIDIIVDRLNSNEM
jgi:ribose 5-phosphate isomerase RpiB